MKQKFLERENKLIHDTTNERKIKNLFYKQNINLEEQIKNMKKLWHSRSMILKQY